MKRRQKQKSSSHYVDDLLQTRDSVFARFPLLFTLLGAFGFVAVFYGFNGIINRIPLLANNPYISLLTGLAILVFTGKLYKKLG